MLDVWAIQFHTVIFNVQSIFPYITELMKTKKKKTNEKNTNTANVHRNTLYHVGKGNHHLNTKFNACNCSSATKRSEPELHIRLTKHSSFQLTEL